ncbi:polyprenyl synthetase family protein [Porcipelethomonas ammoniilytica]|uniref:polyprenyl synthetase family protein n=1 Tax=Porcipelethomonas ammoniilytica TaxID=2981722 RepID=UPI000820B456|nr:farnesyl diphosphate synthase [Porcipelethomonas ammoniilytica]MCU6718486.1 polyprenyl synthetase family protein [Porcipelethomonas ammoniilytica]SCI51987.1 Farnesyl diphosphate synthase [uncultured Ruminococcus sp.]
MNDYTKKTLNEYISFTESTLKKFSYKNKLGLQSSVADAMDYSLEAGGKRIRPVLVLAFCHMCGGDYRKAAAPAAAIEMIHTFSLIHDDLPCMDNDDFRRGKPSCHKKFGEVCAVLAGDALAIRPFQVIAESELNDSMKIKLIAELACSSGAEGMIGGQIIDMENEQRSTVNGENLRMMYALKTGRLIKTSCVMGCIAAEASDEQVKNAEEYAHCLGLAFQIIDDILDVTGDEAALGKPIGSDAEENKTTFVTLYGIENAREEAVKLTDKAMKILGRFDNNEFLIELTKYLLDRNY